MIGIVLFVGRSHFTCTFFLFRESRIIEKKLRKGTIITSRMIWLRSPVPPPPTWCSSWAQLAWQWYYPDAVSPQWDCCEPSSGRVSPRGYCKALWLPVYSTDSTPGVLFPILIWSIATWPWSTVVWMRVPPMKQMLEYHTAMVGSDYELRGWLGIQSLRCVREENCLSCLHRHVHVWIVDCFISFPYAANCWFRYDDQSAERLHSCDICFLTRCMAWWRGVVQMNPGDGISVLPINISDAARCWSCFLARHTWRECGACGRSCSPCSLCNKELLALESESR